MSPPLKHSKKLINPVSIVSCSIVHTEHERVNTHKYHTYQPSLGTVGDVSISDQSIRGKGEGEMLGGTH